MDEPTPKQTIVTITDLPRPSSARSSYSRRVRISATHNPFTDDVQHPAKWLTEEKVKELAQMLVHRFSDPHVNWHEHHLRELTREGDGSWIVWIFQEWLD